MPDPRSRTTSRAPLARALRVGSLAYLAAAIAAGAGAAPPRAARPSARPAPKATTASLSQHPVRFSAALAPSALKPGGGGTLKLALRLQPGWHVNSNAPLESYLIPTTVRVTAPPGWRVGALRYPAGKRVKLPFSPNPMSLYEDQVTWSVPITVPAGASAGTVKVTAELRYQACDSKTCLPPSSLTLHLPAKVVAAAVR